MRICILPCCPRVVVLVLRKGFSHISVRIIHACRYVAVPETLLCLGVETVRRPADVVGRVERDARQPRHDQRDHGAAPGEHRIVRRVPAHVEVAIDGDERDREQRIHAADDAQAGRGGAQPRASAHQLFLAYQRTCKNTTITDAVQMLSGITGGPPPKKSISAEDPDSGPFIYSTQRARTDAGVNTSMSASI